VNPLVRRLASSPVNDLLGEGTVLVHFRGRRTGRELTTPANANVAGDVLTLTSLRRRAWWRYLRGGAPVSVTIGGRERTGFAEVLDATPDEIAAVLVSLYERGGHPIDAERASEMADRRVMIRIRLEPSDGSPPLRGRALWWRWTRTVTIGEAVGFAIPAVAGALIAGADLGELAAAPLILVSGFAEGLVLGFSQALVIRRTLPAISSWRWISVTAIGALIAWGLSLVPASIGEGIDELPPAALVTGGLVLGGIFLLSIGGLQWLVLREHLPRAGWWVAAVAVAWVAALTTFMAIASPLWQEDQQFWLIAAIGIAAGLAMAVVMAAITGYALVRLTVRASPGSDQLPGE